MNSEVLYLNSHCDSENGLLFFPFSLPQCCKTFLMNTLTIFLIPGAWRFSRWCNIIFICDSLFMPVLGLSVFGYEKKKNAWDYHNSPKCYVCYYHQSNQLQTHSLVPKVWRWFWWGLAIKSQVRPRHWLTGQSLPCTMRNHPEQFCAQFFNLDPDPGWHR